MIEERWYRGGSRVQGCKARLTTSSVGRFAHAANYGGIQSHAYSLWVRRKNAHVEVFIAEAEVETLVFIRHTSHGERTWRNPKIRQPNVIRSEAPCSECFGDDATCSETCNFRQVALRRGCRLYPED